MLKKVSGNVISKAKIGRYNPAKCLATASTIDERELKHFKDQSSTWWDETKGSMKPLLAMNFLRVPFIRDSLINTGVAKRDFKDTSEPLTGLKLLDVGCGGGILSEPLARLGCSVTGIDASQELIAVAQQHAAKDKSLNNLTYLTSSIEEFTSNNSEAFDAVIASEVIEHVNDTTTFVSECVKCLKPGGSAIFTTLNKTSLAKLGTICIAENILRIVPMGTHEYEKFIEPQTLQRLLEDNDCAVKVIHGMWYNYFTNDWWWSRDTSINYIIHAVKMEK